LIRVRYIFFITFCHLRHEVVIKRPQLSLSERLRMEFGLDDSEEEKDGGKG
jgi:hypothetical protein